VTKSGVFARLLVTALVAIVIPTLIISLPGYSQSVEHLKKDDEEMRRSMVVISRQLGVNCTTCHNTKNFASAEKVEFRVAKDHMRLTQVLIDNGMDGKDKRPKADCFMCHRGTLKPDYKEPFDPMTMEKEKIKVPAPVEM
jgi:hypothetical protein